MLCLVCEDAIAGHFGTVCEFECADGFLDESGEKVSACSAAAVATAILQLYRERAARDITSRTTRGTGCNFQTI